MRFAPVVLAVTGVLAAGTAFASAKPTPGPPVPCFSEVEYVAFGPHTLEYDDGCKTVLWVAESGDLILPNPFAQENPQNVLQFLVLVSTSDPGPFTLTVRIEDGLEFAAHNRATSYELTLPRGGAFWIISRPAISGAAYTVFENR